MTRRGRPRGTLRGFRLAGQKWGVAFALYQWVRGAGLSGNKAAMAVFAAYCDLSRASGLVEIERSVDGRYLFKVKLEERERGAEKKSFRRELPLLGSGARLDRKDFETALEDIGRQYERDEATQPENTEWLIQTSEAAFLVFAGSTPEICGEGWIALRRIAPKAILPAWLHEPIETSVPPYIRAVRIAAHQMAHIQQTKQPI